MLDGGICDLCDSFVCVRLEVDAGRHRLCSDYLNHQYDYFEGKHLGFDTINLSVELLTIIYSYHYIISKYILYLIDSSESDN